VQHFYISEFKTYIEGRKKHKPSSRRKKKKKIGVKEESSERKDQMSAYDKAKLARSQLSSVNRSSQEARGWINMLERISRRL